MKYGISLYPGLEGSPETNLTLLNQAAALNCTELFISFNIPEVNQASFQNEVNILIHAARNLNYNIISDVSPSAFRLLGLEGIDTARAAEIGLTTLRLDFGFTPDDIAKMSQNPHNVKIQLNASTISPSFLIALAEAGANFSQITALHNYYPREHTGLSEAFFLKQTRLLQGHGIKVYAFVPGEAHKRAPICAGLPTLEQHRSFSVSLASRHLAALGIDGIIIGDSFPTKEEIASLSTIRDNIVQLSVNLADKSSLSRELLSQTFTARPDEARDVIRAEEARDYIKKGHYTIEAQNNIMRSFGAVTLDNKDYLRYMGELQIMKHELPADARSNVIAQVAEEELFLLSYIIPGQKFTFLPQKSN